MDGSVEVTVEFFGIPRQRAGRAELTVQAKTVGEALRAVAETCPALAGMVSEGRLAAHHLLSVNGTRFVADLSESVRFQDRLLLLSADAGG